MHRNKLVGAAAIILTGLCYKDEKISQKGLDNLKKIIKYFLDDSAFLNRILKLLFFLNI